MNRMRWVGMVLGITIGLWGACGALAAKPSKASPGASKPARPTLPFWAPKNPSPEFLRTARIIKKPLFDDRSKLVTLQEKAANARFRRILVPAWELFGSLSDAQIKRLLTSPRPRPPYPPQLRLPYRSLTAKQRSALNRFFEVYRQTMKGVPPDGEWPEDMLVGLYKLGAREDLSNLLVTFRVGVRGRLALILYVVQRDGKLSPPNPLGLGDV